MNNSPEKHKKHIFQFGFYRLTFTQELLLKAALLKGQSALTAWEQWKARVDIETLDSTSFTLLPQLYQTLLAHGVEDPHMARLKGIYRRTWYANQLQIRSLHTILAALAEAGIDAIVLGDAALNFHASNLPVSSFHLLLRQDQLDPTFKTLTALDWEAPAPTPGQVSIQFKAQQQSLYIQTRLFWAFPQDETDEQVWRRAISLPNAGFLLDPTDQLLEICARTFLKARGQTIQGLADAFLLIQRFGDDLDWQRLITQAQRYRMILPLRNTLTLLHQILELDVPNWVLPTLVQMPLLSEELSTYQVLAGEWQPWLRAQSLPVMRPLEQYLFQLRHRPFPGRQILKTLLVPRY
ncbi:MULTISPECIES: nucleotidyltransferase family protein [Leptolyngbya]|uniref:nucleotidyltransferase family protein n=1 Tax=Leptolyngbya TaxID=47251 RepID=UPI001688731C|nr:nucleotidyltransferase family protein [Leptolyngbya sp. FACHB-1624]MBD1859242.1 nucleotidyltransferase family protein [Leptolyngbya sp. FACHB-1624]